MYERTSVSSFLFLSSLSGSSLNSSQRLHLCISRSEEHSSSVCGERESLYSKCEFEYLRHVASCCASGRDWRGGLDLYPIYLSLTRSHPLTFLLVRVSSIHVDENYHSLDLSVQCPLGDTKPV